MLKHRHQQIHQEAGPHIHQQGQGLHGEPVLGYQVAGPGNVRKDIPDEDQRDNFELVGDGAGGGGGQRRNQGQHLVEEDEVERRRYSRQVVLPGLCNHQWGMGERPRQKNQEQMDDESRNAQADGNLLERRLVALGKDRIVCGVENQQ